MQNKNDHPWIGVDNIIINEKGEILLGKRSEQEKNFQGKWNLVSGMMEWGETVEEALKREAMEEIGVEVEVVKFTGRYYDAKDRHPTKTCIALPHLCKIVSGEPRVVDPEEIVEVKWFKPEEIREMELAYDHKKMLEDEGLI